MNSRIENTIGILYNYYVIYLINLAVLNDSYEYQKNSCKNIRPR